MTLPVSSLQDITLVLNIRHFCVYSSDDRALKCGTHLAQTAELDMWSVLRVMTCHRTLQLSTGRLLQTVLSSNIILYEEKVHSSDEAQAPADYLWLYIWRPSMHPTPFIHTASRECCGAPRESHDAIIVDDWRRPLPNLRIFFTRCKLCVIKMMQMYDATMLSNMNPYCVSK